MRAAPRFHVHRPDPGDVGPRDSVGAMVRSQRLGKDTTASSVRPGRTVCWCVHTEVFDVVHFVPTRSQTESDLICDFLEMPKKKKQQHGSSNSSRKQKTSDRMVKRAMRRERRAERARLTDDEFVNFNSQLQAQGLRLKDVPGDGCVEVGEQVGGRREAGAACVALFSSA